jgi:hypothetical protein
MFHLAKLFGCCRCKVNGIIIVWACGKSECSLAGQPAWPGSVAVAARCTIEMKDMHYALLWASSSS